MGSPPLARGTVLSTSQQVRPYGITPACAGNRCSSMYIVSPPWDHPRLRGEQKLRHGLFAARVGSPPLARGTGCCAPLLSPLSRITPACAGNSKRSEKRVETHRDHPRLRGEQENAMLILQHFAGSPPLARGTGFSIATKSVISGITPACAGNRYLLIFLFLPI